MCRVFFSKPISAIPHPHRIPTPRITPTIVSNMTTSILKKRNISNQTKRPVLQPGPGKTNLTWKRNNWTIEGGKKICYNIEHLQANKLLVCLSVWKFSIFNGKTIIFIGKLKTKIVLSKQIKQKKIFIYAFFCETKRLLESGRHVNT